MVLLPLEAFMDHTNEIIQHTFVVLHPDNITMRRIQYGSAIDEVDYLL